MGRTVLTLPAFLNSAAAALAAAVCLSLALFSGAATARAQTRGTAAQATPDAAANGASPTTAPAAEARAKGGEGYHIGAGDVLDIRVFNRPQLSREAVRVDGNGMIRMPLVEGEIQAACRTEAELARSLESLYLKYLRSPHVDVFVKEFQSQPVAVIGAVNLPGRFQLQRPMRLLELLTLAGGPSERAGARVQVAHAAAPSPCEPGAAGGGADDALSSYRLGDTLGGGERSNPYVRPGDIVNLPEAEQAFVVGNVLRPTAIDLKEPVTVSRAIAMAGGTMPDTRRERVRILRQTPGAAQKQEIFVDLRAVERQQAEDVALQPDDIVDVPVAGGKRALRSLLSGVFPAAGQLPVQVIGGQVPTAATRRR